MNAPLDYRAFLEAKTCLAPPIGFDVPLEAINPELKPFTRAIVQWAIKGGRQGSASELNPAYFLDGVKYVEAAARDMAMPDLITVLDAEREAA